MRVWSSPGLACLLPNQPICQYIFVHSLFWIMCLFSKMNFLNYTIGIWSFEIFKFVAIQRLIGKVKTVSNWYNKALQLSEHDGYHVTQLNLVQTSMKQMRLTWIKLSVLGKHSTNHNGVSTIMEFVIPLLSSCLFQILILPSVSLFTVLCKDVPMRTIVWLPYTAYGAVYGKLGVQRSFERIFA